MPFGLTNAPAVFQNLVNDVLGDMINKFIFVYLDDILILSRSKPEHIQHMQGVLKHVTKPSICKAEKCEFLSSIVSFLGFIVSASDIKKKNTWPRWKQSKTGPFLKTYSLVAAPLH